MFGESELDYLSDEELAGRTEHERYVAAQRRRDHAHALESRYVAAVVTRRHPGFGPYVCGVVLVRNDEHKARNTARVGAVMEKFKEEDDACEELRRLGFPVLYFNGLDPDNPCTLVSLFLDRLGTASRRTGVGALAARPLTQERAKAAFEAANARFTDAPKEAPGDGELKTHDPNTEFLCQNCGRKYRFGDALEDSRKLAASDDRYHPHTFCSSGCQRAYLLDHGGATPTVTAEIPLGQWETCNLPVNVDVEAQGKTISETRRRYRGMLGLWDDAGASG